MNIPAHSLGSLVHEHYGDICPSDSDKTLSLKEKQMVKFNAILGKADQYISL